MESGLEWSEYQRLDSTIIIDFLSSTAAAMADLGMLSPKDSEDLRLCIRNLQKPNGPEQQPVMTQLTAEGSKFLALLLARFGALNLNLNVLRLSLRPHLIKTQQLLSLFGQSLLEKAKLGFNLPFYVYIGGHCERRTLFSSILVELSECFAEASEGLATAIEQTYAMLPCDNISAPGDDNLLDEKIREYLGFKSLRQDHIPHFSENRIRRLVAHNLWRLAETVNDVLLQYQANFKNKSTARLEILCEWLKSEAIRLSNLALPRTGDIEAWELRRHNLNLSVMQVNRTIEKLHSSLGDLFGRTQTTQQKETEFPEAVRRQIALELMLKGASPQQAQNAALALINYCIQHGVEPNALLTAELSKIHPALTVQSLQILQETALDKGLSAKASVEKERLLKRCGALGDFFAKAVTRFAPIALVVLALCISCGLKTAPKSDVDDFRPPIPFRAETGQIGVPAAGGGGAVLPEKVEDEKPQQHEKDQQSE